MMDQKQKFFPRGIRAEFLGEAQTDQDAIESDLKGHNQLVFISPETMICNAV